MDYKLALMDFLSKERNRRYASYILDRLTGQYRHGYIAEVRNKAAFEIEAENVIKYIVEESSIKKRRYTATIVPTIITPEQAPNFWFKNEKMPEENEIYRFLFLLLTGLYFRNYVINLDNIDLSLLESFRDHLINEELFILPAEGKLGGINLRKLFSELKIRLPATKFSIAFSVISYFVVWFKSQKRLSDMKEKIIEMGLPWVLSENGINDDVTLIIFNIHRQKKEMYIIPRFKDFIIRWYEDYLSGRDNSYFLPQFISSLYINHKDYREISSSLIDKFIYYLLRGYVNGELLINMINLKIKYELEKGDKRINPISGINRFLNGLESRPIP